MQALSRTRRSVALAASMAAVCCATWTVGSCRPESTRRPNVLLVTIDTLRADHLSCYGYARATSPNLDALAHEGRRFTHAQSPRAKTTPALASLMTGLYPHDHGVRDLASPLDATVPTLAESLRAGGYRTGAIVGNWVLGDARSGLARGFDVWCEDLPDVNAVPPDGAPERKAASLTDGALRALGLLEGARRDDAGPRDGALSRSQPWFLWVHYMDPHGAYDAPAEQRVFHSAAPDLIPGDAANDDPLHRRRVADYNAPASTRTPDGRIDAAKVRDLYDAEIRYVDHELGRLFQRLRDAHELDDTLVIVTADHGESLGEHRYWFEHGAYAYEATCRVPLLVRPPRAGGSAFETQVRDDDVSLVDFAPALLAHLGVTSELRAGALAGRASAPLFSDASRGAGADSAPVFCEKVERADLAGAVQIKGVRSGDWKLLQRYASRKAADGGAGETVLLGEELYDLATDPHEATNLAAKVPASAPLARLRRDLARSIEADDDFAQLGELLRRQREGLEARDPDAVRVLKALGY